MENLLTKFFYTGLGAVSLGAERLQKAIDEAIGDGKVSEEEGKKVVESFINDWETRRDEFQTQLQSNIEKFTNGIQAPEFLKTNFVADFFSRLERIEKELGIEKSENTAVQNAIDEAAATATEAKEAIVTAVEEAGETAKK
ncbi:MAG: hypothetical protein AAFY71_26360 [Bacteroidota bacterium]